MLEMRYTQGSLILVGEKELLSKLDHIKYDDRIEAYRAEARSYRDIVLKLREFNYEFSDFVKDYSKISVGLMGNFKPREHQEKALSAWQFSGQQGVVVMPTGSGKTLFATMAIASVQRSSLIVVPTIDLLYQWKSVIEKSLSFSPGILGGGHKEIKSITVATYESARLYIEKIGNMFGFIIFDECHHLPAPHYQIIAKASIAPFRLGLTATVERADGGEKVIFDLLGPLVFEGNIRDLVELSLSPYDVVTVEVELTELERKNYNETRKCYLDFVREKKVNFSHPGAWKRFLFLCSRSQRGEKAFKCYLEQKSIAQKASKKFVAIWDIIVQHASEKRIIFTDDNKMAYEIGARFLLPVITHKTRELERKHFLDAFRSGEIKVLVTSKVLNEGVDVPDASVGIVVSGSGAVREHVQRLGRILRHQPGKRATLYEVLSRDTGEVYVNKRRKRHHAYQGSN